MYSQNAVVGSAGNISSASGSVSYSIGQLAVESFSNATTTITPGVQQPFEISEIVNAKDVTLPYSLQVYPNPTTDYIWIDVADNVAQENLTATLTTTDQKTVLQVVLTHAKQNMDISTLPAGVYILTVANDQNLFRSYRIMKQ